MLATRSLILLLFCGLASCASDLQSPGLSQARPDWLSSQYVIPDLPFFGSRQDTSASASLAALLRAKGLAISPVGLETMNAGNSSSNGLSEDIMAVTRANGYLAFDPGNDLQDLLIEISVGNPVMVAMGSRAEERYAIVKGYDLDDGSIVMNSNQTENLVMRLRDFERSWIDAGRWAMLADSPGELPATATEEDYYRAVVAFAAHNESNPALGDAYLAGLREWPESLDLLMGYADYLSRRERYYEATDIYSSAMSLYPEHGPAHHHMAQALIEIGQFDEAEYHLLQAMELDDGLDARYSQTLQVLRSRRQQ